MTERAKLAKENKKVVDNIKKKEADEQKKKEKELQKIRQKEFKQQEKLRREQLKQEEKKKKEELKQKEKEKNKINPQALMKQLKHDKLFLEALANDTPKEKLIEDTKARIDTNLDLLQRFSKEEKAKNLQNKI